MGRGLVGGDGDDLCVFKRVEGEREKEGTYCEGFLVHGRDDEPDVPSRAHARPDRFAYL